MCQRALGAAASTPGTSTTPSPTATIGLRRLVGRAVLHVQQPDARAELGHELRRIGTADLRPVDVDLGDHVGREVIEEVQERRTTVGHRRELPEVVVVAERDAARARAALDALVDAIGARAHVVEVGERVVRQRRDHDGVATERLVQVERGVEPALDVQADVRARHREPRVGRARARAAPA